MRDYFTFEGKSAVCEPVLRKESKGSLNEVVKYDFVFDSSDDLKLFLDMHPLEFVYVISKEADEAEEMTHSEFMDAYFKKANRIYTSRESELVDLLATLDADLLRAFKSVRKIVDSYP